MMPMMTKTSPKYTMFFAVRMYWFAHIAMKATIAPMPIRMSLRHVMMSGWTCTGLRSSYPMMRSAAAAIHTLFAMFCGMIV